jgi:hypothetical protein
VALNTTTINLVSCLIYKRWLRPSAFVRGIDVVNMATSVSRALDVLCMMFEIILYDSAVGPVICGGWHFARMLEAHAWLHRFAGRDGLDPYD